MTSSAKPVASAILAVYNAESTIDACLKSLLTQSIPIEIIVVDDGSTDVSMIRIIDTLSSTNHKVLTQYHGGPALARNLGASHASTRVLLFVDADMTFDKDYVRDLIAPIQKGEVVGTYTVEERVGNWDNVWARCWNIQEGWKDKKRFPANPPRVDKRQRVEAGPPKYGTDFRAILKSEFDKVGGFENIGYTDTWSLFAKLGVRPLNTKAICYHKNPDTLSAVFRQARWSAKRPYKYGLLGTIYALLRSSLPVSLVVGIAKAIKNKVCNFVFFKLVYDLGRFIGILEMLFTGKLSK
jgi:glycosyltransferase involved in cell wall biosynthesis